MNDNQGRNNTEDDVLAVGTILWILVLIVVVCVLVQGALRLWAWLQ